MEQQTIVIPPTSPCVCGSGKGFGVCHLVNGKIAFPPSSVVPSPQPQTGFKKAGCIFEKVGDCNDKLSGDHFLSETVLKAIAEKNIFISGPKYSGSVPINSSSLKSKVMCVRHNNALSPIDTQAGRLIRAFQTIDKDLASSDENFQKLHLFNGNDIERWMLKTLLTAFYGNITNVGPKSHTINPDLVNLFTPQDWPKPYGFYFRAKNNSGGLLGIPLSSMVEFSLITNDKVVSGINIGFLGFSFSLIVTGVAQHIQQFMADSKYRPPYVSFFSGEKIRHIGFLWGSNQGKSIQISRNDPNATMSKEKYI